MNDAIITMSGKQFMQNAKGSMTPLELVKPEHQLEDELVRKIIKNASTLKGQIIQFRALTMLDIGAFDALLEQEYGVKKPGKKGNRTYRTYDDLQKVVVQVHDTIDFGPQLQTAKMLFDECMNEWKEGSRPEIQALITDAFKTDKEGKVNRSAIFSLLKLNSEDKRWLEAVRAIHDAMRIISTKEYVRFYQRDSIENDWLTITINISRA